MLLAGIRHEYGREREAMSAGDDALGSEPNGLLSSARHARRLTQQQLAEAVGAAHWRLFDREAAIDADHVSKLERGLIRWPNRRYREAFRVVLGATTDAELGFYSRLRDTVGADGLTNRAGEVIVVRPNESPWLMIGLAAGLGLEPALGLATALPDPVQEVLSLAAVPVAPGRVGRTDVALVGEATATLRSLREQYGGPACRDVLVGQLRWGAGLLLGRAEGPTRRDLHSAVGSLADMAGWGDVDAGRHETARSCFRLALYCAEEARDWDLRAEVLTDMSRQAVDCGQLDLALSLIELAQLRADRVAGTGRAMMSSTYARTLGVAGRAAECKRAVLAAGDHFTDHQPADENSESPFFRQASEANLILDNGQALFSPGLVDPDAARVSSDQLRAALDCPDTIGRRRCAMGTAKLATLQLLHGDREEGVVLGHRALDLGDGMYSTRLIDDLRKLHSATARHTSTPVDGLRLKLDSVLVSS